MPTPHIDVQQHLSSYIICNFYIYIYSLSTHISIALICTKYMLSDSVYFLDILVWRGGLVVGRRDLRSSSRGFEARPRRCCVTTLGKLFTPYCLCHQAVYFGTSESWEVNRHIAWCINPYHVVSQCSLMPGCRVGLRRSAPTYGKR